MFLTRRSILWVAIAGLCLPSVSPAAAAESTQPLRVVATTGMIADIVRAVGGDAVEVRQLLGAGVDPHLYKATRSDIAAMIDADAVFYNGLLLEGKMSDAFIRIATAGKPVFAVTELIGEQDLIAIADGHHDPHVWMDPRAWSKAVEVVRARLAELAPNNADQIRANAAAVIAEIAKLDTYAETVLGSIPAGTRILVTAHDAFQYLGRRYGIEVHGIQGLSTESEAGLRAIEDLVTLLADKKIPAVFVESTISPRSVEALIAGAKSKGHTVTIGASLYSDAMGPPGTYEGTYIGMIDHNVTAIARALGGTAPDKGYAGRLSQALAGVTP